MMRGAKRGTLLQAEVKKLRGMVLRRVWSSEVLVVQEKMLLPLLPHRRHRDLLVEKRRKRRILVESRRVIS